MVNFIYNIVIYPIIQIVEFVFSFSYRIFKIPGFSILCVSTVITILCLPVYAVAEHWQEIERNTEKELKPGVDRIKKSFKGDEQYFILSTFYREHKYHPIYSLRSSFGLLIQIPFFIAAYIYLSNLDALRGTSFLFIKDLGTPDKLLTFGRFSVNMLPVAMTVINCISGAVYTKGFPVKDKVQLYVMALVFLFLLYPSPSGLVLYWTMNNIFSLIKNLYYKIPCKNKLIVSMQVRNLV